LSNFNFDALDPATRDETLTRLSYPVVPNFGLDPFLPFEPAEGAWQQTDSHTDWQQNSWQPHSALGHAYNESQGAW
jgi:hypothetical protein